MHRNNNNNNETPTICQLLLDYRSAIVAIITLHVNYILLIFIIYFFKYTASSIA